MTSDFPDRILLTCKCLTEGYYGQEDQILILYDTMWNGTALLADALKDGLQDQGNVKVIRASTTDKSDIITDIFKSKIILFGSPTVNAGILSSIAAILEQVKGLKFKNKKAASFGCFGWSGESIEIINSQIKEAGLELINNGYSCVWEPDDDTLERIRQFAKNLIKENKK